MFCMKKLLSVSRQLIYDRGTTNFLDSIERHILVRQQLLVEDRGIKLGNTFKTRILTRYLINDFPCTSPFVFFIFGKIAGTSQHFDNTG